MALAIKSYTRETYPESGFPPFAYISRAPSVHWIVNLGFLEVTVELVSVVRLDAEPDRIPQGPSRYRLLMKSSWDDSFLKKFLIQTLPERRPAAALSRIKSK